FGILIFPQITLVLMFLVMAVVLVVRPWGLLGRPEFVARGPGDQPEQPYRAAGGGLKIAGWAILAVLAAVPLTGHDFLMVLLIDILLLAVFATSLHFI